MKLRPSLHHLKLLLNLASSAEASETGSSCVRVWESLSNCRDAEVADEDVLGQGVHQDQGEAWK